MKTIYLIRHAKSSWDFPLLSDEERPLIEKGIKRTKKLGDYLKSKNIAPEIIFSSHANRAFNTAQIIAKKLNIPEANIKIDRKIYNSGIDEIFLIIFGLPEQFNSVMLFGHNPVFTNLVNYFSDEKIDNLPTSGFACIEIDTKNWNEILNTEVTNSYTIFPKKL